MAEDKDRVSALESKIATLQEAERSNNLLLQQIVDAMKLSPPQPLKTASPEASAPPRKKTSLRPSPPADFNGDRTKGKAFLMSCRAYIRLVPESFDDEAQQIVWAMTFMKSGRASVWAQRIFREEEAHGLPFVDWFDFENEFRKHFTPLNSEATAINKLEGTTYFQKNRSVDDYLNEFRDLIAESGYTDKKNIVVKF